MGQPPVDEYTWYLQRFDAALGPCEPGTYVKHHGRLIKRLSLEEFLVKRAELAEVETAWAQILARGDTINDVLVRILRERRDELLVDKEV
jgi:hypothetical protein